MRRKATYRHGQRVEPPVVEVAPGEPDETPAESESAPPAQSDQPKPAKKATPSKAPKKTDN